MGREVHETEAGLGSALRGFLFFLTSSLHLLLPDSVVLLTHEHLRLEASWRKGGGKHKAGDPLGPCWAPCYHAT